MTAEKKDTCEYCWNRGRGVLVRHAEKHPRLRRVPRVDLDRVKPRVLGGAGRAGPGPADRCKLHDMAAAVRMRGWGTR